MINKVFAMLLAGATSLFLSACSDQQEHTPTTAPVSDSTDAVVAVENTTTGIQNTVFRGFGNEPGWNFLLRDGDLGQDVDLFLDYNTVQHVGVILKEAERKDDSVSYNGVFSEKETPVVIVLKHTPCMDTMADDVHTDYSVILRVGAEQYIGCGEYQ